MYGCWHGTKGRRRRPHRHADRGQDPRPRAPQHGERIPGAIRGHAPSRRRPQPVVGSSSGCALRWSGGLPIITDVLLVVGVLDSQLPSPDHRRHGRSPSSEIGLLIKRSPPDPPFIWPHLSTARMPSISAGARVAPITIEVATATVRDAKQILTGRGPRLPSEPKLLLADRRRERSTSRAVLPQPSAATGAAVALACCCSAEKDRSRRRLPQPHVPVRRRLALVVAELRLVVEAKARLHCLGRRKQSSARWRSGAASVPVADCEGRFSEGGRVLSG